MAVLTDEQRADATLKMIRRFFVDGGAVADLTTTEVRGLVDAMDSYIDANAAAINTNIPQPLRGKATADQKAYAMAYVALKRAGAI